MFKLLGSLILVLFVVQVLAVPGTEKGIQSLPIELREQAAKILAQYEGLQKLPGPQKILNLDLEDKAVTSVYNKPGIFSTSDCQADAAEAAQSKNKRKLGCAEVGSLDNKAALIPTGKIEFRVEEDEEGTKTLRIYTEVKFAYSREGDKAGTGWMAQDYIAIKPTSPSYSDIIVEKFEKAKSWVQEQMEKVCPPSTQASAPQRTPTPSKNNLTDLAQVSDAIQKKNDEINKQRRQVSSLADRLSGSVGKCVLKPPNKAPEKFLGSLVYDQFALPTIKSTSLPKDLKKEDGQALSQKDLVDIDALARTMYAEMASCTPIGAQYPMAVARVIRNRELAMQKNSNYIEEFIKNNSEHDPSKSLLCKAATSPVLFSAWNQNVIDFEALKMARAVEAKSLMKKKHLVSAEAQKKAKENIRPNPATEAYYKPNESGLLHTLCPPSDPSGICYTGGKPDQNSSIAWQSTLKIAVEAVLFPKQFETKTAELSGIKHYTSNRGRFYDFIQVNPSIEGRKISSSRCLNLWRPMTPAEKEAKEQEEARKAKAAVKKTKKKK